MNNQQQPQMQSKTLAYFEDALTYEALACMKCEQYQAAITDPGSRKIASDLAASHKQQFNALFNYLSTHQ